ncbi:hypothetical protein ESZ53_08085 [Salinibacterium sp. UTAS2018]|uniref:hypothetical protein n=1 Tax=Salinibacterium sp. UTAS2018 TaxID=2508880 RepID=UPI0010095C48|nr:hypothetical protein [Salinibacterium sp. UTAS2018]QAV70402.1 hypothetical protein ESZ53_08085 [Salinibacterium sp. UTAS2018]
MTSHDETQDQPMMDGATEASASDKQQGKKDQMESDAVRNGALEDSALEDAALEDSVRSVRAVGEDRTAESADGE